ncbi:hypothetical protein ACWD4G_34845 [Streptomyces sp. NPDC002643]
MLGSSGPLGPLGPLGAAGLGRQPCGPFVYVDMASGDCAYDHSSRGSGGS